MREISALQQNQMSFFSPIESDDISQLLLQVSGSHCKVGVAIFLNKRELAELGSVAVEIFSCHEIPPIIPNEITEHHQTL